MPETLQFTSKKLAKMLACSVSTLYSRYMDDMKRAGVVWEEKRGSPPQKVIAFFPSVVKAFLVKKAGENHIP